MRKGHELYTGLGMHVPEHRVDILWNQLITNIVTNIALNASDSEASIDERLLLGVLLSDELLSCSVS